MNKELELEIRDVLQLDEDEEIEDAMYFEDEEFISIDVGLRTYAVLNDEQAFDLVVEEIEENLWTFQSWFLSNVTGIDTIVFDAIQNNNGEDSNNEAIKSLLDAVDVSIDSVAEQAIIADGLGHFIAQYDGEEIPTEYQDYSIYRID